MEMFTETHHGKLERSVLKGFILDLDWFLIGFKLTFGALVAYSIFDIGRLIAKYFLS